MVRLGRRRAALLAGALLVGAVPFVASATAPHLTCGPVQVGRWETIPVRPFQPIEGLTPEDRVRTYAVDRARPQDVAVTNGQRVQLSRTHGCDWQNSLALDPVGLTPAQPFAGAGASIVSVGLLNGKALAAVREGNGSTSRPHVMRYDGSSWNASDNGLPPAGAPRLLRAAADGRTAYLTISPTNTGGSDDGAPDTPIPLPTLPGVPPLPGQEGGSTPTGLLYATTDAGSTWELRTTPTSIPGGGAGFTVLELDPANPNNLYGIVDGRLLLSRDGGNTFTEAEGEGYTALATTFFGMIVAFDGAGHGALIANGKRIVEFAAPKGITSAASRAGDSSVMVESNGALELVGPFDRSRIKVPAPKPARARSLVGDNGVQSSYHAIAGSGHDLLRFVDPVARAVGENPTLAEGDQSITPPVPGTISPAVKDVRLMLDQTTTEQFTLDLPKNPTPLDLFFLVDVSTSMTHYIENLKKNIHKVVDRLTEARIDLRVGVATLGTGPAEGEAPYPDTYAYPPQPGPNGTIKPGPTYRKPRIYELIHRIDTPGPELREKINSIQLETDPPVGANHSGTYHEGQLLALEQAVTGSGIQTEQDVESGLNTYSAVKPGQEAGFRGNPDVRRIVVLASDEAFDVPYGTPQYPGSTPEQPKIDYRRTLKILNDARVGVFGITAGTADPVPEMTIMARGTRTVAPPGGVSCGGDPPQELQEDQPLVCSQDGDFSAIIGKVLSRLTDKQDVHLVTPTLTPVLRGLDERLLAALDVKKPNRVPFTATVSCVGVPPGTYEQQVVAMLRDFRVGTTRIRVQCVAQAAVAPFVPPAPPVKPPVAPAVQPPVPPPAPPPAAQPQPQPQPNINPLTAAVTQEQEEAQLALATQELGTAEDEEPETLEQLAMSDRRSQEAVQALGVLAIAMTACAALGLAGLRAKPEPAVRRVRA